MSKAHFLDPGTNLAIMMKKGKPKRLLNSDETKEQQERGRGEDVARCHSELGFLCVVDSTASRVQLL